MYYGNDHTWIYWWWCYAFTCLLYRTNSSFIESWLVEGNQIRPCTMTNLMPSMSLSYQYRFLLWLLFMIFWPFCYAQLSAFLCTPSRQWFFWYQVHVPIHICMYVHRYQVGENKNCTTMIWPNIVMTVFPYGQVYDNRSLAVRWSFWAGTHGHRRSTYDNMRGTWQSYDYMKPSWQSHFTVWRFLSWYTWPSKIHVWQHERNMTIIWLHETLMATLLHCMAISELVHMAIEDPRMTTWEEHDNHMTTWNPHGKATSLYGDFWAGTHGHRRSTYDNMSGTWQSYDYMKPSWQRYFTVWQS
jgi:hypothetical protein